MFTIDEKECNLQADIRVLGIGGGGGNAVETMQKAGINGVKFIAVNTDAQALSTSGVETKIQLGANLTKGLGAGANPEVGRRAAIESYEEIVRSLKGADMVFITAGMGGGTGTGGISVIAEAARELGALTVGVVTYPFLFEGRRRRKYAEKGIGELKGYVDTLIVIPNDKLLELSDDKTPLTETFKKTDDVLFQAVKGIAELISVKGLINLDFADVKTVMLNKGMALMGVGVGEGGNRVIDAVSRAVSSPLLENTSIKGATGIIVNITGSSNLSLTEVNQAISLLTEEADPDADIIVGAVIDESKKDTLSVTVIATGFEEQKSQNLEKEPKKMEWAGSPVQKNPEETFLSKWKNKEKSEKENKEDDNDKTTTLIENPDEGKEMLLSSEMEETSAKETEEDFLTETPCESPSNLSHESKEAAPIENQAYIPSPAPEEEMAPEKEETAPAAEQAVSIESPQDGENQNFLKEKPQTPKKSKGKLTPREILLSKVKEYKKKQNILKNEPSIEDRQIVMPLNEENTEKQFADDEESFVFETEIEFSPEDTT